MGHQESLLFCDTKKDMIRLCKLLNRAALDTSEKGMEYAGLDIYEVARLKKDVTTWYPGHESSPTFPKGCYFVWWGGERGPQTADEFLLTRFRGSYPYWNTIFTDYLSVSPTELLIGIEKGHSKQLQENEWMRTFHPGEDNQIFLELVEQL